MSKLKVLTAIILLSVSVGACKSAMMFGGKNPRDAYADGLRRAGLDSTALARQWFSAAGRSLAAPVTVTLPYKEQGIFTPDAPRAFGYRFSIPRGQKINITLDTRSMRNEKVFLELWHQRGGKDPKLLLYADTSGTFGYEADDEDMQFVLRLQAELLATVSYTLTLTASPSLAFPVSGSGNNNIGSIWGDPRDAGARRHEGIDIFGKRGTPVVAAANGRVSSVAEGGLGGKTVWLRPSGRNISLYYAHLDSQLVSLGQAVDEGDTLGLMGNTGNARNTPTHLHFGIYASGGAIDPLPFVKRYDAKPANPSGEGEYLGKALRTSATTLAYPSLKDKATELRKNTYVTVLAAAGTHYKVLLPDGTEGYIPVGSVTALGRPLETRSPSAPYTLYLSPHPGAPFIVETTAKALPVKAYYGGFAYIEADSVRGWISQ